MVGTFPVSLYPSPIPTLRLLQSLMGRFGSKLVVRSEAS
jgi:hypothetical protein